MAWQVYKAKMDGALDVAVKFLKPEAAEQAQGIMKFVAEIDIMRACSHPNILSFLGAWAHQVAGQMLHMISAIMRHAIGFQDCSI